MLTTSPETIERVRLLVLSIAPNPHNLWQALAGDRKRYARREIMTILHGAQQPFSKCGVNAIMAALYQIAGIRADLQTAAAREDALGDWLLGQPAQAQAPALPPDGLGDFFPGLPDMEHFKAEYDEAAAAEGAQSMTDNQQAPAQECPPELAECLRLARLIGARVGAVVAIDPEKGLYDRAAIKIWGSINIEHDPELEFPAPRSLRPLGRMAGPEIKPGYRVYAVAYDPGNRDQPPDWEPAREEQFEQPHAAVAYAFRLWLDCLIDGVLESDGEARLDQQIAQAEAMAEQIERSHAADDDARDMAGPDWPEGWPGF